MSESNSPQRTDVTEAQRVVVKLGTRVTTQEGEGVALSRIAGVVEEVARCVRQGKEMLIVSSGAVGLGRQALGLTTTPTDLIDRQVCAAVGQSRLMELYQMLFSRLGLVTAQVLLTELDFRERGRYLNLRGTLSRLLARSIVPIINENDVVATDELALDPATPSSQVFGDNDMLSALVASELDAQLLVLLTDVDGVYDADPQRNPAARLLSVVENADELAAEVSGSTSGVGRGGMRNKVAAAALAARAGCHAVIASGLVPGQLLRALRRTGRGYVVCTHRAPHRAAALDRLCGDAHGGARARRRRRGRRGGATRIVAARGRGHRRRRLPAGRRGGAARPGKAHHRSRYCGDRR